VTDIDPAEMRRLTEAIKQGDCVAFVGAGFSGAANLPGWRELLQELAGSAALDADTARHVETRIRIGSGDSLDEAAQILEDGLGRRTLLELLRERLADPPESASMAERTRLLAGIPFQAVLTTNFDGVMRGGTPTGSGYRDILRQQQLGPWDELFWGLDDSAAAPVMKLHGDLLGSDLESSIVLTRRDYRRRLYSDVAYQTFLRSVMATTTVLYMGFSFQDAYLNELRSEVLALFGHQPGDAPVAYAIANDVPDVTQRHFTQHEGIRILSFDSKDGTDFSGFDGILRSIHDETNPVHRFARHLQARRILWMDPHPENNTVAFKFLSAAAAYAETPEPSLTKVHNVTEALDALAQGNFDAILTHWGQADPATESAAEQLMIGLRRADYRVPTIVFAARTADIDARRQAVLGLGGVAYCFRFKAVLQELDRLFGSAAEHG